MSQSIKKVFSKEYQKEVEYLDLKYSMRDFIKLKNKSESIVAKVDRLKKCGYVSNCSIEVGDF